MAYRDFVGVVLSVKDDEPVFAALQTLSAGKHHATAVLINVLQDPSYAMDAVGVSNFWGEMLEQARTDFENNKAALERRCTMEPETPIETRAMLVSASFAGGEATTQARHGDLTVMLRPAGASSEGLRNLMFEAVLFGSGRPVLLVPPNWSPGAIGRNIVVGWDGKREAVRAIADAMPLLESATSVTVVAVNPGRGTGDFGEAPGVDITAHLARHGVNATLRIIDGLGRDEGEALLLEARALEADLIVAGGYGKARLREWVFGGVTRALTQAARIPVLLSH